MKLHHKEWPCVILKKTRSRGEKAGPELDEILPPKCGEWKRWSEQLSIDRLYLYRSSTRYFQFSGAEEEMAHYFEDVVHPRIVKVGRSTALEYPVYCFEQMIGKGSLVLISAPYAGLLAEITSRLIRPHLSNEFSFVRPLIEEVYKMAREVALQPPPKRIEEVVNSNQTSVILRGGRITLTVDDGTSDLPVNASIRSLVLMGTNILKSALFTRLVDEGIYGLKFNLDPALAKVAFRRGNALGVVVKMDRYGHFHFRPGYSGRNLENVAQLISHCASGDATETSLSIPLGRTIENGL
jgi:hypothetical protein